jgi:hypothetical protein
MARQYKPKGMGIKSGWKDSAGHVWENDDEKIQIRDRDRYGLNGASQIPTSRSALDRMFDMLQVGQYVVQGGIHGAISDKTTVMGDAYEGLKAGNPFGMGNQKGEFTTSQNLGELGWQPESTGGKIAKGAVGFIGDVLLDPLTYINPLSVGGTAVFKGTGQKVGKEVVEKFSKEMAEKVLKQSTGTVPKIEEVTDLVRRVNKSRGIVEEGSGKGFGLYGSNIPFANKLGIADKKLELVSEAKLRAFGDATIAPYLNKVGDKLLHSKAGKLFSTKADLLDMARRDPQGLAMGFQFAQKAGKAGLTYKEALVELKDDFAKLTKLEPENQKLITKMLEDPKLWEGMTTYKPLKDTDMGKNLMTHIEGFVKKYGMEDKNMQKVMGEITPKFKSGEKVTMRFPGMKDTNVIIEGMTGFVNGVKHYKIRGYKQNIPETAFKNVKEVSSERITKAYATHMDKVKKSVDAGERGRINLSNDAMGVDKNGVSLSQEFDDMIESGVIPITKGRPKGSKSNPYKDYKTNPNDYVDDVAVDKIDGKIADYESKWLDAQKTKSVDEVMPKEVIKSTTSPKVEETATKVFENGKWVDKPKDIGIVNQSSLKWKQYSANKVNESVNHHKEFKRFITDKIRVDDEGKIRNGKTIIGDAKNMKDKTPLSNLTGIKGLNKNSWNTAKKDVLTTRSFFEKLTTEEPAVKEMFEGLVKNNAMGVPKDKLIKQFVDTYFNEPYYKPADMVHLFHKDRDTIIRMLEDKHGKYETMLKRDAVDRKLYDGTGLKPLETGKKRERMEDFYKLMNDPEAVAKAERKYLIEDGNGMVKMAERDSSGVLKSYSDAETETAFDKAEKEYVNSDRNLKDMTDQKTTYIVMKDKKKVATVELADEGHVWYKNADGEEFKVSIDNMKRQGYSMFEPDPDYIAKKSVTGTVVTKTRIPGEETVDEIVGGIDTKSLQANQGKIPKINKVEEDVTSSDLFKAKDEVSASKYVDDEPLERPKTQQEINDAIINAEDDVAEIVTKSENVPTPVRQTTNSEEARFKIEDDFNLGLISETVNSMMGKEVQGAYKTVEQALSELPTDINKIITKQQIDNANKLKLEKKLTDYRTALSSQAEFERFAKTLWGDTKFDRIMKDHATTIRAIDKPDFEHRDLVEIAKGIRKDFKSIAQMESAIGHLDNKVLEGYVFHKVNPLFKSPLADFTQEELDNMGIKIPKNQFEIERQYTKGTVMPDGHTLTKGTIEEINEHIMKFGEDLNKKLIEQGKQPRELHKLFEDEISDIYLARMQGHYKLMYDDAVYGDITMKFGKKYEGVIDTDSSLTVSTQKLRNVFKRMSKDDKAKYLENYGFTKEEFNKLGNSFVRVSKEQADKITKDGFAEVHQVGNIVLDKADKLSRVQMAEDTHGLLGAYDKFLRTYKLMVTAYRPAFHFNNMKGNAFNNWLDVGSKALSPKFNMASIDMALGKNMDTVIKLGGKDYTYKQIVDELTIQGKIGNGFFGKDIKKELAKELEAKTTTSPLKKAFNKPTEFGSQIEDQGKIVNFIANLDLGKSFSEAGEHVDKFLFDYGDITKFESEAMKRIFPFYTWMRKNAPLQLEQMLTNPKRYAPVAKAINEMEDMVDKDKRIDKNKVPAFGKDWVQLPFNIMGDNGNMEALMWSNNLPYLDINKIPNILSPKDSAVGLFESSSPAIKMPIELGTNYNYFFDRKIDKGAKVVDPSGRFEVSPQLAYVLSQIPQYAEPGGVVKKSGIDRLIHILDKGMASGVKSYDNKGYGGSTLGDYQGGDIPFETNTTFLGVDGKPYQGNGDYVDEYTNTSEEYQYGDNIPKEVSDKIWYK